MDSDSDLKSPLESGTYTIFSKAYDLPVSRNIHEDFSLNPKGVFTLPKHLLPQLSKWKVTKLHNGNYTLSVGGGHAADIDHKVKAVLQAEPHATEWKIERPYPAEQHTYLIYKAHTHEGWVVPEAKPETQIAVKPIIVQPSHPPKYPASQLFVILK